MARSHNRTILTDDDGRKYQFNNAKFDEVVRGKKGKQHWRTLTAILEELHDVCHVSKDSIKKWMEERTGPSDLNSVKAAGDLLEMDYHDLLIPVMTIQEENKMPTEITTIEEAAHTESLQDQADKEVVQKIYAHCISVVYTMEEFQCRRDLHRLELDREMRRVCTRLLREAHLDVDRSTLVLRSATRYMLHRILLELEELVREFRIPERWDSLSEDLAIQELYFLGCEDRDVYLTGEQPDDIDCRIYLYDEINLAENLGFEDIVVPTEEEWDNLDQMGDINNFGYAGCLTPSRIAVEQLVCCLNGVFCGSFPELFG